MDKTEKQKTQSLQHYARAIHRVLGYLAVGLVIVFSLSGIVLVHRSGDFMKHSQRVETTLEPGLDSQQLKAALRLKNLGNAVTEGDILSFDGGQYNIATGQVSYISTDVVAPFNQMTTLHKVSDGKNHGVAAIITIFGIVLFLLAVTSLFMYKPAAKCFKRNMLYTALGVILAVILVCVV